MPVPIDWESEISLFILDDSSNNDISNETFNFVEKLLVLLCDQFLIPLSKFKVQMSKRRYSKVSNKVVKLFCYIIRVHQERRITLSLAGRFLHRTHASILNHMPDDELNPKLSKEDLRIYGQAKKILALGIPIPPSVSKELMVKNGKAYDVLRTEYQTLCLDFVEKEVGIERNIFLSRSRKVPEVSARRLYIVLLCLPVLEKTSHGLFSHRRIVAEIGMGHDQSTVSNTCICHRNIMTSRYHAPIDQKYRDIFLKGLQHFSDFFQKHKLEIHPDFLSAIPDEVLQILQPVLETVVHEEK